MKKLITIASAIILVCSANSVKAQSLSDLFSGGKVKDVVTSVTGGASLTVKNIAGEWTYIQPAVELSSDNMLSAAGGTVVSSQFETKLNDLCLKVGIKSKSFVIVFKEDMTFTTNIKGKNLGGSYTIDAEARKVTMNFGIYKALNIGKLTASVTIAGNSLSLLFPADRLLSIISSISSMSSNESLQLLNSLTKQYDGVSIGVELEGEPKTQAEETSSAVEKAANAFSKWF